MDSNMKNNTYGFIVDYFTEEKIQSRYAWLYNLMQSYLEAEKIQDKVYISEDILNHVIIDYFVDIYRLKEFQDIETTHDSKIYAYLISWILRHKPLQIPKENAEKSDNAIRIVRKIIDVDNLNVIAENINKYKEENSASILIITHYPHILNYIKPDYVHIMNNGSIVKTGDYSLALSIEKNGYEASIMKEI